MIEKNNLIKLGKPEALEVLYFLADFYKTKDKNKAIEYLQSLLEYTDSAEFTRTEKVNPKKSVQ